jgi:hypothetical protein
VCKVTQKQGVYSGKTSNFWLKPSFLRYFLRKKKADIHALGCQKTKGYGGLSNKKKRLNYYSSYLPVA